jgi:hypothetical protein
MIKNVSILYFTSTFMLYIQFLCIPLWVLARVKGNISLADATRHLKMLVDEFFAGTEGTKR